MPPSSPGTSTVVLPALLHMRCRKRKCKAKVRLKGERAPSLGSCRPWADVGDVLVGWSIPGAPSCPGAEGEQRVATHGLFTLHSSLPTCGLHTFEQHNPSPVLIPPLSRQFPREMFSLPQLGPLGGSGHPSFYRGRCRAVTSGSHITVAWFDSKRRSDPSCLPLLCQELSFCSKELAA